MAARLGRVNGEAAPPPLNLAIAPQAQQADYGTMAAAGNELFGFPMGGEAGVEFHQNSQPSDLRSRSSTRHSARFLRFSIIAR
jgi:hypothetical protein